MTTFRELFLLLPLKAVATGVTAMLCSDEGLKIVRFMQRSVAVVEASQEVRFDAVPLATDENLRSQWAAIRSFAKLYQLHLVTMAQYFAYALLARNSSSKNGPLWYARTAV